MSQTNMGAKSLDLLRLAAMPRETNEEFQAWKLRLSELETQYSAKAVDRKMEELTDRGYTEYGVSARTGWLTDKGRQALLAHNWLQLPRS